jgi:hypothetical protein
VLIPVPPVARPGILRGGYAGGRRSASVEPASPFGGVDSGGRNKSPVGEHGITPGKMRTGRRPVPGCSNHTSVAARLSLRTPDRESRETARSALWHRGATVRARVLAVIPWGHTPGCNRGRRSCPLPMSFGGRGARHQRIFGENATDLSAEPRPSCGSEKARAHTPTAPVAGGRITDMVHFFKVWLGTKAVVESPPRSPGSIC